MKNKIIFIHPGIQYTYRQANAVQQAFPDKQVYLYTWFTLKKDKFLAKFSFFVKRIKPIDQRIHLHNYLVFELLLILIHQLLKLLHISYTHYIRYRFQIIFGYFLLPVLYLHRKNSIWVLSETAGWPLAYYGQKWGVPIIMDFPSLSHEFAAAQGIEEIPLGKKIKALERKCIDFSLHCSQFALESYDGLTSAKQSFALWLGAETSNESTIAIDFAKLSHLHIAFIGNTAYRKGLDILLSAFAALTHAQKKLFIIGKIEKTWVLDYCRTEGISADQIIFAGSLTQSSVKAYLIQNEIQLHVLPSRFDSFGMVVPETMMLGVVNILSPYVGAGEMLVDNETGFIMETLSVASLERKLNDYCSLSVLDRKKLHQEVYSKSKTMRWEDYDERIKFTFKEIFRYLDLACV